MISKQLAAGLIAAVLTAGAAGAAVTVNLATSAADSPTQAGQLVAQVEPTTSTTGVPAPPSTIYIDVTVPDLPPVAAEPAPAPEVVVETGSDGGSGSSGGSWGGSGSSDGWTGSTGSSGGSFGAVAESPAVEPAPAAPRYDDDRDEDDHGEDDHGEDDESDDGGSDDD